MTAKRTKTKDFVIAECGASVKQKNFDTHYRNCRKCRGKEPKKKPWLFFNMGKNRIAIDPNEAEVPIPPYKTKEKL